MNDLQAHYNDSVAHFEGTGDLVAGEQCLREATTLADLADLIATLVLHYLALLKAKRLIHTQRSLFDCHRLALLRGEGIWLYVECVLLS